VPRYLTDAEFRSLMAIPDAIAAVEACFKARAAGALGAFVRRIMPVGPAGLALTPGGSLGLEAMGLRAYPTGTPVKDQLTAVWHPATGDLLGMVAGTSLGAYRTGAIGAIAVREGADDDAHTLALIGAGLQAATQLPAICAVRPIREVRVFRRDRAALDAFVKSHAGLANAAGLAVSLIAAASAREAVRGADSRSSSPTGWAAPRSPSPPKPSGAPNGREWERCWKSRPGGGARAGPGLVRRWLHRPEPTTLTEAHLRVFARPTPRRHAPSER